MHNYLAAANSTNNSPYDFFTQLFESNLINSLRIDFMPDLYNPDFKINNLFKINEEEEWYIVIHADYDPDEVKYLFKDFLYELVAKEKRFCIQKLKQALIDSPTLEKSEQLCTMWVDELMFLWKIASKNELFVKYDALPNYLGNIINFLFTRYPSFCKKIPNTEELSMIRNQEQEEEIEKYNGKPELAPSFFKTLAGCIFKGTPLFEFDDYDDEVERKKLITTLRMIFYEYPESYKCKSIKFNLPAEPSYYVIKKLIEFYPKMNAAKIEKIAIIQILDKPFKANNFYQACIRFNHSNPLITEIDNLFEKHLM